MRTVDFRGIAIEDVVSCVVVRCERCGGEARYYPTNSPPSTTDVVDAVEEERQTHTCLRGERAS